MKEKEIEQALCLFSEIKALSRLEMINDYEDQYQKKPEILDDLFQYLLIFFEPENADYYSRDNMREKQVVNVPQFLPQNSFEINEYCIKNLYCMMLACYKETVVRPYETTYEHNPDHNYIENMTLYECINYIFYNNRRGIDQVHWSKGISKRIILRIIELRKSKAEMVAEEQK